MTSSLLVLFHFLTFTFGFTALILISRRIIDIPATIRRSFFNQALFYNLTIIFMTIQDLIILISGKELSYNPFEAGFMGLIVNLNNAFSILWCFSFVVLVYRLLDITITKRLRIILSLIKALFLISITYNFIGTIFRNVSLAQEFISILLCYASVFVLAYSILLLYRSREVAEEKKKKALRSFGLLFIVFSIVTILFYTEVFFLHIFKPEVSKLFIYCIDFTYNSFIVFWSIRHLDSLRVVAITTTLKDLSADLLIMKYQISKREQEIIQLVCSGKSNQEIADTLFISLGTVKNHLYNIFIKLGVKNRTQLVKMF